MNLQNAMFQIVKIAHSKSSKSHFSKLAKSQIPNRQNPNRQNRTFLNCFSGYFIYVKCKFARLMSLLGLIWSSINQSIQFNLLNISLYSSPFMGQCWRWEGRLTITKFVSEAFTRNSRMPPAPATTRMSGRGPATTRMSGRGPPTTRMSGRGVRLQTLG